MNTVLTIAGSDSGGGAGIQADLKTCAALGAYGLSVITAVTAQSTVCVSGVHELPPGFVGLQLDTVLQDIRIDAVKTGMLANGGIIEVVAEKLAGYGIENLVVDPVMVAKTGARLLSEEAINVLREKLLPLALVVTPNIPEARVLAGLDIESVDEMHRAARAIHGLGPKNVLIKGGHLPGDEVTDVLFDGREFTVFSHRRVYTPHTHGTGCTLSAALACKIAQGLSVPEAVQAARAYLRLCLEHAFPLGKGRSPVHHTACFYPCRKEQNPR